MIEVPSAVLDRHFGRETVRRGRAYLDEGRVREHEVTPAADGMVVTGRVQGSRPLPYDVSVRVSQAWRGVEVWAVCSCPVALSCKHGAAVLLSTQGSSPAGRTLWSRDLDAALDALEGSRAAAAAGRVERTPLALQVDLAISEGRWQARRLRTLRIRPLQRGKLGAWIKTGVDWSAIPGLRYRDEHDPAQVEALAVLATSLGGTYGSLPNLASSGPALWPLLRRLRDAGVVLEPAPTVAQVEVLDEPVRVVADLSAGEDQIAVRLLVVAADGRTWTADEVESRGGAAPRRGRRRGGGAGARRRGPPRRGGG
ncbi:MAG: SWIM zinc finger family protein, partial [Marmoricola sp.]